MTLALADYFKHNDLSAHTQDRVRAALLALVGGTEDTIKGDLVAFTGAATQRLPIGADGLVLVADTAEGVGMRWGTVGTSGIANNSITNLKLRDSAGCSVIGRAGPITGDPSDLVASNNGKFLRRMNDVLSFGTTLLDLVFDNGDEGLLTVSTAGFLIENSSHGTGINFDVDATIYADDDIIDQTDGSTRFVVDEFGKFCVGGQPSENATLTTKRQLFQVGQSGDANIGMVLRSSGDATIYFSDTDAAAPPGHLRYDHSTDTFTVNAASGTRASITSTGINSTAIGASTQSTGAFTQLSASGSASGYTGGEIRLAGGAGSANALATIATGAPIMFFDHRGAANTGSWQWRNGTDAATTMMALDPTGGLALFGGGSFGGGTNVVFIANRAVAPSSNPAGGGLLYANSGAGVWHGSGGTVTTFGPANPHCPECGSDFVFEAENEKYGYLAICWNCLARSLGNVPFVTRTPQAWHSAIH